MKKSLLALAVLGAFAGAAQAQQSSVTLYGLVDPGVQWTNKGNAAGDSAFAAASGQMQGSRFGLKGSEDLGSGLKAVFTLEAGFNVTNGKLSQGPTSIKDTTTSTTGTANTYQSSRIFGRQAFAGLSSTDAGTVTIGRQYDSFTDFVGPLSSQNTFTGNLGAHYADNDNLNNSIRFNNTLKYTSVNYAGFSFSGLYAFSDKAGGFAQNSAWSVGAGYKQDGWTAALGILQLRQPNYSTANTATNASGAATSEGNIIPTAVSNQLSTTSVYNQRIFGGGVGYAFGPAAVGLVYTNTNFDLLGAGSNVRYGNYELNGKYDVTPEVRLGAAFTYTTQDVAGSGSVSAKYKQVALTADYFLSKRTDGYLGGVWQGASGSNPTSATVTTSGSAATPSIVNSASGNSSTNSQVIIGTGLRLKF